MRSGKKDHAIGVDQNAIITDGGMEMSKTKFTPGPWRLFSKTGVGNGKTWVADCENVEVGFGGSVDEYNAALISAAPEMYDFGEATVEVLRLMLMEATNIPSEVSKMAEVKISEWEKISKKARNEILR
jgi:hypothetical protein